MSETAADEESVLVECRLDAPTEKVWRALTTPELAADWLDAVHELPSDNRAGKHFEIVDAVPLSRVVYRWTDRGMGHPHESLVIVEMEDRGPDRTWFRLTHRPPQAKLVAANTNCSMALAA